MSYYHLFVKNKCPFCKEAKELLGTRELEHVVTSMDEAPLVLERLKSRTKHMTVPIIFEVTDEEIYSFVGGCQQLKESLNVEEVQEETREDGKGDNSSPEHRRDDSMPTAASTTVEPGDAQR